MEGRKDDNGKPQWHLLPFKSVEKIVEVLTFGAMKYSANNWCGVPDAKNRYFSAMLRHITAWQKGEKNDDESGMSHLAHAGCCLLFLMELTDNASEG